MNTRSLNLRAANGDCRFVLLRSSIRSLLVASSHEVIEIKNVRLDLIPGVVTREMRHLQHVNDGARIAIAPSDQLIENMIEV
jgi:hypothetical protein